MSITLYITNEKPDGDATGIENNSASLIEKTAIAAVKIIDI